MRFDTIHQAIVRGIANMGERCDANESMFFARELENIVAQTYEVKYGQNLWSQFMPIDSSGNAADETRTYRQFDWVGGDAKVLTNWKADDFEGVDVFGQEFQDGYFSIGKSYGYTLQEMRASQKFNRPLDAMRASAAKQAMDNKIDKICLLGSSEGAKSATGVANAPNVPSYSIGTAWDAVGKTAQQIVDDLLGARAQVTIDTLNNYDASTLLLPLTSFTTLATKRTGVENTRSALEEIRSAMPGLRILPWTRLETVNAGAKRGILLANNPDVLVMGMPVPLEQFAPSQDGQSWTIRMHSRVSGVRVRVPKALRYLDGL